MGIQDYIGYIVKLGGYLPVCSAVGGVRYRGVDPSTSGARVRLNPVLILFINRKGRILRIAGPH
jgi:hypothetical protein